VTSVLRPRRALVIGGGIGGLAAGVALRRIGWDATVFERAEEIHEVGAGLSLWSNAVNALRRLGVEAVVVERATRIERIFTVTSRGKKVSDTDIGAISRAAGAPSVCAHRADLQRALADALGRQSLSCGKTCIAFEQHPEAVVAQFSDGTDEKGDILIGADGIRSIVRARLVGDAPPRYAGYTCWRGIAHVTDDALPPGRAFFALGRATQIGIMHCGAPRVYWFATVNAPEGTADGPLGRKAEAVARFAHWPAPIAKVIEATEERAIIRGDIIDRPPIPRWGLGRVTLLGDAAHPTTPNLGQGACQALEDAIVLAKRLHRADTVDTALRDYERARIPRTRRVVETSFSLGNILQLENRAAIAVRDWVSASWLGRSRGEALMREFLNHELPELPEVRA
jgi:2-polyprenyl-6-methoxyphenol hydroxylase-like FAD-dependent oxidoreductase